MILIQKILQGFCQNVQTASEMTLGVGGVTSVTWFEEFYLDQVKNIILGVEGKLQGQLLITGGRPLSS